MAKPFRYRYVTDDGVAWRWRVFNRTNTLPAVIAGMTLATDPEREKRASVAVEIEYDDGSSRMIKATLK